MNPCEYKERIWKLEDNAIPSWVRTFILGLLLSMLCGLGGVYVHAQATYSDKEALKEFKDDIKSRLERIENQLDDISSMIAKGRQ